MTYKLHYSLQLFPMWDNNIQANYYYPTLEIVGVSNGFIRPWAILIS
jgi:hypothetical protein